MEVPKINGMNKSTKSILGRICNVILFCKTNKKTRRIIKKANTMSGVIFVTEVSIAELLKEIEIAKAINSLERSPRIKQKNPMVRNIRKRGLNSLCRLIQSW